MSFDFSGLANTAVAQIADKGRAVTLVYVTPAILNKDTDVLTPAVEVNTSVTILFKNYNRKEVDGTLIKTDDKLALLSNETAVTRAPKNGDKLTDGSETYTIKTVREIQPGDTVLLYEMQVRL